MLVVAALSALAPGLPGTAAQGLLSAPTAVAAPGLLSAFLPGFLDVLAEAVKAATGPAGLAIIFAYSFLIAVVLPLPSEIVLLAPLDLGLGQPGTLGVIMLTSGLGEAAGSLLAFKLGHEARSAGPIERRIRNSRFDVYEWSEARTVELARDWGFVGLALALCVPGFPDTLSIYAFAVLEDDYVKFAAATFAGSVGRLLVTIGAVGGVFAVI